MNKEQLAEKLNGREYGSEIEKAECAEAKAAGLVVIFGYSDDNVEFRGAVFDEVGIYGSGKLKVSRKGALPAHDGCDCEFCGYNDIARKCVEINVAWATDEFTWELSADIPSAPFTIFDGGEKYCRGLVISIDDIPEI